MFALTGCATARGNARVEPGFSFGLAGGAAIVAPRVVERERDHSTRTEPFRLGPSAEVQLEHGWKLSGGTAISLGLKVPLLYFLAAVDVYAQLGDSPAWSHGLGCELGFAPAVYHVVTRHLDRSYLSLTNRLVAPALLVREAYYTPQLTMGRRARVDLYGFVAYGQTLGRGFDIEVENTSAYNDHLKRWLTAGVGVRF